MSYPQPGYPPASGQPGYPPPYTDPPPGGYQPTPQMGFQPHSGYVPPGGQPGGYQPPPQQGYQPPPQQGYQPPPQQGYQPQGYPPGGYGQPIAVQPTGGQTPGAPGGWMNMPQGNPNIPQGLEYLTMIDQLCRTSKTSIMFSTSSYTQMKIMEMVLSLRILVTFTGFETQNKYTVKNSVGQKVYYAVEDSDCLTRNCCGPIRPFDMKILDNFKNEIIHLNRPLRCDSCWFPCCLQTMEVTAPPGTVIGSIEQQWSILKPIFDIKNAAGDVVLKIEGPICTFSICGDVEFKILSQRMEETQVGKMSKQWSGNQESDRPGMF
ncbi:hypothetical protein L9F63_010031 [Diploptera punctata]|uniref:Phospholipid scramblase n=1 Tax=Diploptera punctata TaxID=6984 RepID=A0AAD8AHY8_DIPPU|nr:hypothetical protein L9F63_010031 [Diploptera punctata]